MATTAVADSNYRRAYGFAHDEGCVPFDCVGFAQHVASLNAGDELDDATLAGLYRRHVAEVKAAARLERAR